MFKISNLLKQSTMVIARNKPTTAHLTDLSLPSQTNLEAPPNKLYEFLRQSFLTSPNSGIDCTSKDKKILLCDAIRKDDYELAARFLDKSTVFAKDEYGDRIIDIALSNKQWKFLNEARKYVVEKNSDIDPILGIIREEIDATAQTEMIGYAKDFYEIE